MYTLWTNPNLSQNWSDTLIVYISQDCGITWTKIWEKAVLIYKQYTLTMDITGYLWNKRLEI